MIYQLSGTPADTPFPDPRLAETEPNGLLAIGGDLSRPRLLQAYRQGVFPWYSEDQPILWWSPDPRTVLYPGQVHVSRSLRRRLRRGGLELRIDSAFDQVTAACAEPRGDENGTWLLPEMRRAYADLYRQGDAHAIELWAGARLVGGLYGVAIGRVFFGESMFSRVADASKVVMVYLSELLSAHSYAFLDCQVFNPHLARMGAVEIPRGRFLDELRLATDGQPDGTIWRRPPCDCSHLEHAA